MPLICGRETITDLSKHSVISTKIPMRCFVIKKFSTNTPTCNHTCGKSVDKQQVVPLLYCNSRSIATKKVVINNYLLFQRQMANDLMLNLF